MNIIRRYILSETKEEDDLDKEIRTFVKTQKLPKLKKVKSSKSLIGGLEKALERAEQEYIKKYGKRPQDK